MTPKPLKPHVDAASLFLRWGLAATFIVHGYYKLGQTASLSPTQMDLRTQNLLGWAEMVCGVALAVGLLSRLAALGIVVLQTGAVIMATGKYAFQALSFGRDGVDYTRVGPEYNLVLILMALSVMVLGSGKVSLDHCLVNWFRKTEPQPAPEGAQMAAQMAKNAGQPVA